MKLPRFTLRELFLLVVIAAMGCGWWVHHNRLIFEVDKAKSWRDLSIGGTRHMQRTMREKITP